MKASYRRGYLKSDHWAALRLARIAKQKGKCAICRKGLGLGLDVHHVRYKNLYDVDLFDLKALCRRCHTAVHVVLELYPKINESSYSKGDWGTIQRHTKLWLKYAKRYGDRWANLAFEANLVDEEKLREWSISGGRKFQRYLRHIFGVIVSQLEYKRPFMAELMARFENE